MLSIQIKKRDGMVLDIRTFAAGKKDAIINDIKSSFLSSQQKQTSLHHYTTIEKMLNDMQYQDVLDYHTHMKEKKT